MKNEKAMARTAEFMNHLKTEAYCILTNCILTNQKHNVEIKELPMEPKKLAKATLICPQTS